MHFSILSSTNDSLRLNCTSPLSFLACTGSAAYSLSFSAMSNSTSSSSVLPFMPFSYPSIFMMFFLAEQDSGRRRGGG